MDKPLENKVEEVIRRQRKRLPLLLRWVLEILTVVIVLPVLIFQIPWVQSKAAQKLTAYLSDEWQTEVSVGKVTLGIFNKIKLDDVFIEDLAGDTLLKAGRLEVNHSGIFLLPFKRFKIESLRLEDTNIYIHRAAGQEQQNFQFIVDYFSKDKKEKKKSSRPFRLDLRHVYLQNVRFHKPDEVKGEEFDVLVNEAEAHFDRFDLAAKRLELASLKLDSPDIKINLSPEKPIQQTKPPVQLTAEKITEIVPDTTHLLVTIKDFDLGKGRFSLNNTRKEPVRSTPSNILDYNYLDVFDIEIHVNNFSFSDLHFNGQIENMSLRDSSGFVLEKLAVQDARLSCLGMELNGLEMITPYSHLGDTLIFRYDTYHAFENFVDDVKIEGHFRNARVALKDIMVFAPVLENNTFFKENEDEILQIEGLMKGPVNRLNGRDLKINMAGGIEMEGSFSTRNLAVKDEQFLHLNLDRLSTHVRTLRKLIPNFKPPENFDRLGRLNFSGKFDGFFVDFVADGRLRTDIGRAEMFMNLKIREGKEKARYSGDLYLQGFDLGAWSGNPDFGKVTLNTHVKEGVGLTLNSLNARLEGTVDSLRFKGYVYKNATLNGRLTRNLFNGDLVIEDNNINLTFGGEINFADTLPAFDFKADIRHLALKPLNIITKDLQFLGNLDLKLKGKRLSNIIGDAKARNLLVIKNGTDTLMVDSAVIASTLLPETGQKRFVVNSSLGHIDIEGKFNIEKIPTYFTQFITSNYPAFSGKLGIKNKEPSTDTSSFHFSVRLLQLQNLFSFFEEKLSGFDESIITGNFDGFSNQLYLEIEVPHWEYQNIGFNDVYFRSKLKGGEGSLQVGVIETQLSETQKLSPVSVIGSIYEDTLEFLAISSNFYKILDNVNINGLLTLDDDNAWKISFKPSDLVILNQTWAINTANFVRIGEGKVETQNFVLSSGEQRIVLKSVRNEGLELQLQNYPLDSLDFIKNIQKHRISGIGDLHAKVKNIFKFQGLSALLRIDNLTLHGDNYGVFRLDASAPSIKETINGYLSIENDSMALTVDGYFNPPGFVAGAKRARVKDEPLYFDFDVNIANYPTRIIQYFVADVLNVKGTVSAENVRFYGLPSKPELAGEATVKDASFKLKALQTTYMVPAGKVKITSRVFDGTGSWAYDRFGNKAYIEGGITHDHLKNFGLDVRISTESGRGFLGLETTEKNNPVFYGTAIGSGYVRFTGNFKQPSLYVNGRTLGGTHMFLPMTSTASKKEVRFISFPPPSLEPEEDETASSPLAELRGLNMEFDLEITPDAKMEVIFDKAWGDVLQGTGAGRMKVIMTREGRFDMYGDYTVTTGNYLFTLMNLGLNKPFIVEPGGTVSWSGDPYNATINVKAVYEGLSTSVYNFIQEYLSAASSEAQDIAHNSTQVDLKMALSGSLLRPDIAFDIDFPALDSELRNYAENKMRILRQDPNELNRQVFGLLILQQFLPSGFTIQAGELGINTLSEMLSNQLSMYLTEFITEIFTGSNLIQGVDLDISYNRYSAGATTNPTDPSIAYTTSELRGRLKVIVSDRISIHVGGNFDVGGGSQVYTTNSALLAGEFQIDYVITKDRRLKIKAYNRTEPDFGGGRRNKIGVGISFRKEFDSLSELASFWKKKKKEKSGG
jgi:hypothetical protein